MSPDPTVTAARVIPPHHRPGGGFRNPWATAGPRDGRGNGVLRWQWQRLRKARTPNPQPGELHVERPRLALPTAQEGEMRVTWIGQSTMLLQIGEYNLLTDPVWSTRASPFAWAGPVRLVTPPLSLDELPRIDAVLLSHDHYDHMDDATVRALSARFGAGLQWFAPLGYERWLRARGAQHIHELDWWESSYIDDTRRLRITATPAQHWTRRLGSAFNARLWCSWSLHHVAAGAFYFAGDSGYCPAFREVAQLGPFRALALPIGAYEPRWFMHTAHMNPEEAVQAYIDLGATGRFCGMHWGTFRLTDEPPLEPPQRVRAAWHAASLPAEDLSAGRHGETIILHARDPEPPIT